MREYAPSQYKKPRRPLAEIAVDKIAQIEKSFERGIINKEECDRLIADVKESHFNQSEKAS